MAEKKSESTATTAICDNVWVRIRITNHQFDTSEAMADWAATEGYDVRGATVGTPFPEDDTTNGFIVSQ